MSERFDLGLHICNDAIGAIADIDHGDTSAHIDDRVPIDIDDHATSSPLDHHWDGHTKGCRDRVTATL
jgi:hypothetical protein